MKIKTLFPFVFFLLLVSPMHLLSTQDLIPFNSDECLSKC